MSRLRVLYICHNHPAVRPGGAEQYALELHRSLRASQQVESIFLAKGPPGAGAQATDIRPAGTGDGEYFASTQGLDHDAFFGRLWPKKNLLSLQL